MAGYELDLAFLVIAIFLAVNGSKLWSVDEALFNKENRLSFKMNTINNGIERKIMKMKEFHREPNIFVGQVNINVINLDSALDFYQKVIGFQVLEQTDRKAVLTADGKIGLLTLEQPVDVIPKEGKTSGLYHFALLLPTRADLSIFLRHLRETGYQFGASDHLVSEALYIRSRWKWD